MSNSFQNVQNIQNQNIQNQNIQNTQNIQNPETTLFGASETGLKIRRALFSVTDKTGIVDLARVLEESGTEIVATGRTAEVLREGGVSVTPIEKISGSPEAFQGRMKTLSFPVCGGILYRRNDLLDEADLSRLQIQPIDCVVVNFYAFEETVAAQAQEGASQNGQTPNEQTIEKIDIGGPTLVRAAAKNSPDVLVVTSANSYASIISELKSTGQVTVPTIRQCAAAAWDLVSKYDAAIASEFGTQKKKKLRYGENPHQKARLDFDPQGPIAWEENLTPTALSYNNILDVSAGYGLASDLVKLGSDQVKGTGAGARTGTGVVIVKHNNPCGVAWVPYSGQWGQAGAQKAALDLAWAGDPVSAFGSVLIFTDPLSPDTLLTLGERFVELVAAPDLDSPTLSSLLSKRKKLKAVAIRRFGEGPSESTVAVPGGVLRQTTDEGLEDDFRLVTQAEWPADQHELTRFGIAVCRALKSNAIALVREVTPRSGALQLVGAGQGQPNRVEALQNLAIPRARAVLRSEGLSDSLKDCLLVSDAFFPFRDTVDLAHEAGVRAIVQPGGSLRDADSIQACNEHGISMILTGVRHFRH